MIFAYPMLERVLLAIPREDVEGRNAAMSLLTLIEEYFIHMEKDGYTYAGNDLMAYLKSDPNKKQKALHTA